MLFSLCSSSFSVAFQRCWLRCWLFWPIKWVLCTYTSKYHMPVIARDYMPKLAFFLFCFFCRLLAEKSRINRSVLMCLWAWGPRLAASYREGIPLGSMTPLHIFSTFYIPVLKCREFSLASTCIYPLILNLEKKMYIYTPPHLLQVTSQNIVYIIHSFNKLQIKHVLNSSIVFWRFILSRYRVTTIFSVSSLLIKLHLFYHTPKFWNLTPSLFFFLPLILQLSPLLLALSSNTMLSFYSTSTAHHSV